MRLPSGDHAASRSCAAGVCVRSSVMPSLSGAENTSPRAVKSARLPFARQREVLDLVLDALLFGARAHEIARHGDVERAILVLVRVVDMQCAVDLEHDLAFRIAARPARIGALVVGQLFRLAARGVVAVEIEMLAAIGDEEDAVADPDRVAIGIRIVRDVLRCLCGEVVDVEILRPAADVAVPRAEVAIFRRVDDLLPVGRIAADAGDRHGQCFRKAAVDADRVEVRLRDARRIAPAAEQDRLGVRRPAVNLVVETPALRHRTLCRVERQLLRLAAGRRDDIDLIVTAVFTGERDSAAIGREARRLLEAGAGREPRRGAALRRRGPEITRVCKDDAIAANIGEPEQLGAGEDRRSREQGSYDESEPHRTQRHGSSRQQGEHAFLHSGGAVACAGSHVDAPGLVSV